ncbi:oligosaccharide flippase family protein [Methyloversatilis thermotolerans]|uniref:oligosaccharide flippase family protein n=1 Tax=Methyloversatilis thermotolerans TaxID=1346290 RepID=UPI0012FA5737|nr:oligosaccharide flippase family protein [Methyloversatilis thermotolerans]
MSLGKNIALMGTSTVMRLGFGMLTFVVMARMLGPEAFGQLMLWLSVATLLSLLANFGHTSYLLKEIGGQPSQAGALIAEVLMVRGVLSLLLFVGATLIVAVFFGFPSCMLLALLLAAVLADGLSEVFNVGFRATDRFAAETRLATVIAGLQFVIVATALYIDASAVVAACGFCLSRFIALLMVAGVQRSYLASLGPLSMARVVSKLRATFSYGSDFALQSLFGQIDSVVLNSFLGAAAVGVFQAGMRLFTGGAQAASVLANVFLPRAAAASSDGERFRRESVRVQWAFIGVGLVFGLCLAVGSGLIVPLLYGEQYETLKTVLPWLGLLFFVRFFAASWGVVLTSAGAQTFRAWMNVVQWLLVMGVAIWSVPQMGVVGWVCALIVGNLFLSITYLLRGYALTGVGVTQPAAAGAAAFAFYPFLHFPALGFS